MSLVASLDFIDDLVLSTTSQTNITITNNDSTISGINTIKYRANSDNIPETTVTYNLKASKFNEYIFSNTDIINLKFDIYVNFFNTLGDYFNIEINDNNIFYHEGYPQVNKKKFTINYLFKSSELNSILNDNNQTFKIIFVGLDSLTFSDQDEYVLLDRNFELYAIYKPEFSSITDLERSTSFIYFNDSKDALTEIIANANACQIRGTGTGTHSGYLTLNLKNKLLHGHPVSFFFNLNLKDFNTTSSNGDDSFKIQIDKGDVDEDGNPIGFVDYLELNYTNNLELKTFFYSQTENYNSSNDFIIKFMLYNNPGDGPNPNTIGIGDHVFFDNMFTYIPEAINFFDGDGINATGTITLDTNLLINSNEFVGSIELFNDYPLPANYLLCDGSEITKSDNGNNHYAPLIDFLNGNTTDNSCNLPNFGSKHPLGVNNDIGISNYTTDIINHIGNNQLDINYFPTHSHNDSEWTSSVTMDSYNIVINRRVIPNSIVNTNTEMSSEDGSHSGQNVAKSDSHSHNIRPKAFTFLGEVIYDPAAGYANPYTTINFERNYTINSNTNDTIKKDGNIMNENNVELQLKSYKLFFGIRFK